MSPAGERAYEILKWAYGDLGRVPDAVRQMNALARENLNDNDVTDAGTMLSRLAGSLEPAGRNISSQIPGG